MAFFEPTPALEQLFLSNTDISGMKQGIKVVYFWQSDCPCDQFVKPHFLLMSDRYSKYTIAPVNFYLAALDSDFIEGELSMLLRLPEVLLEQVKEEVKATPSVGVWNANNELIYYGPHSLGYMCNDDSSLVKKVLDLLLSGQEFAPLAVVGDGCFCVFHDHE